MAILCSFSTDDQFLFTFIRFCIHFQQMTILCSLSTDDQFLFTLDRQYIHFQQITILCSIWKMTNFCSLLTFFIHFRHDHFVFTSDRWHFRSLLTDDLFCSNFRQMTILCSLLSDDHFVFTFDTVLTFDGRQFYVPFWQTTSLCSLPATTLCHGQLFHCIFEGECILEDIKTCRYMTRGNIEVTGNDDVDLYKQLLDAMDVLGFTKDEQICKFCMITSV